MPSVSVSEVPATMLDQVVHGFDREPLENEGLVRNGRRVLNALPFAKESEVAVDLARGWVGIGTWGALIDGIVSDKPQDLSLVPSSGRVMTCINLLLEIAKETLFS
jgi:hypothetical protein